MNQGLERIIFDFNTAAKQQLPRHISSVYECSMSNSKARYLIDNKSCCTIEFWGVLQ